MNFVLFRADANHYIGSGHVMRCLAIADAFRDNGEYYVRFVTAADTEISLIDTYGYKTITFKNNHDDLIQEISYWENLIDELRPRILFVDTYFVTPKYFSLLHRLCWNAGCVLLYIDDILAFPYDCDVLLNYNIYADVSDYERLYENGIYGAVLPTLLSGISYVPLRQAFQRPMLRKVKEKASNILISTGGSDAEHLTMALVQQILGRDYNDYIFNIIIGKMNQDRHKIHELVESGRHANIRLYDNVTDMCGLMQSMDVAISAAGSTLYELCATQTPTITYVLADNQVPGAERFSSNGLMKNMGDVRHVGRDKMAKLLIDESLQLADDYDERVRISLDMKKIVDGRGTERIVEALKCQPLFSYHRKEWL